MARQPNGQGTSRNANCLDRRLSSEPPPSKHASPSAPACSPPARSGSECLRLPPQFRPQPMHPVRQNISGHSEVCGDVAVLPAVYDSALQKDAVVYSQIPEEGAKPIRCSLHSGDLGDHAKALSIVHLVAGDRGGGPLVLPVLLLPSNLFRPSTYLEPCPSPRERPGNTKTGRLLGHSDRFQKGWGFRGHWSGRGWGLSARGYGIICC